LPSRSNIKLYLSIRWKLILSIILPLIIITAVVMGFTLTRIFEFASVSIREQELGELNLYAQGIGAEFEGLSQIATTTANILSLDDDVTGEELYDILASNVENNPLVYGAAVAWEPFAWNDDTRLFSPYVFEDGDSLSAIDIGAESYDYTDGNWEWYSGVLEQGQAIWTEPYFDEGAGNVLMTTFSAPIFRDGAFAGVTTVDVRLDALNEDAALQFSDENFMILSQSGHFITHYNPDLVMNSTIQDQVAMQNNPEFSTAVERMLAGEFGVSEVNDMFLNGGMVEGESWLFYTPVNATGWILSSTLPRSQLTSELWSLMSMAIYGLALMIVLIIALTLYVSSRLSRPIKTLSAAVSDVARGKLDTSIEKIYSMDELGRLSVGFNRMLKNLKKQVEIQSQQTAARQMVEKELQVARETQQALLPSEFPPFPERREFQLHAVSKAARHVAGDFFDFFLINPRTLVFVIADVSGKGMSAALVMAVTRTIVRNLAENGKTPARILAETNELLRKPRRVGLCHHFPGYLQHQQRPHHVRQRRSLTTPACGPARQCPLRGRGHRHHRRHAGKPGIRQRRNAPAPRRNPAAFHRRHHRGSLARRRILRRRPHPRLPGSQPRQERRSSVRHTGKGNLRLPENEPGG